MGERVMIDVNQKQIIFRLDRLTRLKKIDTHTHSQSGSGRTDGPAMGQQTGITDCSKLHRTQGR